MDDRPSPGEFVVSPAQLHPRPAQFGMYTAGFSCNVGRSAFDHGRLLRPGEYGHGLFGGGTEVSASPQEEMVDTYGMVYRATDGFGMANADVPNAFLALGSGGAGRTEDEARTLGAAKRPARGPRGRSGPRPARERQRVDRPGGRRTARPERLAAALAGFEAEHGPITDEDIAAARQRTAWQPRPSGRCGTPAA